MKKEIIAYIGAGLDLDEVVYFARPWDEQDALQTLHTDIHLNEEGDAGMFHQWFSGDYPPKKIKITIEDLGTAPASELGE